jgi:glycine/D-amino acid oxidase-like deaminating enzyme
MRKTEYLIVGQGISGTFLSWYLEKSGRDFIVIDNNNPLASSRVAAGIINPVTGRRIVRSWLIDTLLPFAQQAYEEIGHIIDTKVISKKSMIDFFPSVQMLNAFMGRVTDNDFLSEAHEPHSFNSYFTYDFGYGIIHPCFVVDLRVLLIKWRHRLHSKNILCEENFQEENLIVGHNEVQYQDIHAGKIIFCDGVQSANSRWFRHLPFALNKGESLVIETDVPEDFIYKKALTLAPLSNNLFWLGSSHEWDYKDILPSDNFYQKTLEHTKKWLKRPFKIVSHLASVRPATVERRPFVGVHPHFPAIAILNGMGTKGCSLAPYFAQQLAGHLTENTSILPEVNVDRYTRILKPT